MRPTVRARANTVRPYLIPADGRNQSRASGVVGPYKVERGRLRVVGETFGLPRILLRPTVRPRANTVRPYLIPANGRNQSRASGVVGPYKVERGRLRVVGETFGLPRILLRPTVRPRANTVRPYLIPAIGSDQSRAVEVVGPYKVARTRLRVVGETFGLPRILCSVRLDRGRTQFAPTCACL